MKKIGVLLIVTLITFACSSKKEGNMLVTGKIKGLKKGTLYLQKMKDTLLVSVDSIKLLGQETYTLVDNVNSPELYYLTFDGNTTDKRILFFGEPGTITINDKVDEFGFNPKISGSKNQEILDKFYKINKKFKNEKLEFIKKEFEAKRSNDKNLLAQLQKEYQKLLKRRVLFTANFAIKNADTEVAPYIGLTEMYDASFKMLDTVNKSLSEKIKKSLYGKKFQEYITSVQKK